MLVLDDQLISVVISKWKRDLEALHLVCETTWHTVITSISKLSLIVSLAWKIAFGLLPNGEARVQVPGSSTWY